MAAAAGLATVAAVTLFAPQDGDLSAFFNTWVYDGLMVLACRHHGLARATWSPRERAAWTVITFALACWTFGEIWYAIFKPQTYPSMADLGYIAFYPCSTSASSSSCARAPARSAAPSGSTA